MAEKREDAEHLKGWSAIAEFLGQPISIASRWSHEGMPVTRQGRFVYAERQELAKWVGTDKGKRKAVHIASEEEDLAADLRQSLAQAHRPDKKKR